MGTSKPFYVNKCEMPNEYVVYKGKDVINYSIQT